MRRIVASIAAALAVSLPLAPAQAADTTVTITDHLTPATVTVAPGTRVVWRNADADRHRVRTTSGPAEFDSGNIEPGQTFAAVFDSPGTYRYVDDRDREN